jgi:hypothetical protein
MFVLFKCKYKNRKNRGRRIINKMAQCEDYPCCGHSAGDCPRVDSKGRERWKCVECGKELKLSAKSSICDKCMKRFHRTGRWRNEEYNDNCDGY